MIPKQPEDLRAAAMQLKLLGLPLTSYMGSESLVDDLLRLCEAAALAALPEKKDERLNKTSNSPLSPPQLIDIEARGHNQARATAQANIHSVFGGKDAS